MTDIHLVIPCFRESGRIAPFLEELCREIDELGDVSLLVMDDGSGREEAARLEEVVKKFRDRHDFIRPVGFLPDNVGKGGTIYAGWELGEDARWLMFADADGSVPAREVARIIRLARDEDRPARAYFASRVTMLGRKVERVWHRDAMSQVFHWLVDFLLGLPAHDTQCGCKLVPRHAFLKTRSSLSLKGFAFDLDLLLALQAQGCEVVEVPVDWHEVAGGKVRLLRDSWLMLADVLRVRRLQASGWYARKEGGGG